MAPEKAYLFDTYRLLPDRRALFAGDHQLPIRSRAFDILLALIERRERVVSKDELMLLVWPARVVEEGNLTVHIAGLRKLLSSSIIATLSGRGYRFVAAVEEVSTEPAGSAESSHLTPPDPEKSSLLTTPDNAPAGNTLPRLLTPLIGRQDDLDRIDVQLQRSRLVTIVSAGGMGKTCLALGAAHRVRSRFPDGAWLAELGPLKDPNLVPAAVASALGMQIHGADIMRSIALFLVRTRCLLILDGCEHLLEAAATMAESILRTCPAVAILATSREPLRAAGEGLQRLKPLEVAPANIEITAERLADYSASAFFVERARAVDADFEPDDLQAQEIMEICRRLDGMPLAIELAVPSVQALTLAELKRQLDHRFDLLTAGRRTALPHQQTLRTTIGWSFDLLSDAEQGLLLRLSVFSGGWTAESAHRVANPHGQAHETLALIASLVDKSLVDADLTGARPRYRMLDSTCYYAAEKLAPSDLLDAQTKLARWLIGWYRSAEADWPFIADNDWFEQYAPEIENLRAALTWAFGPTGDAALGVELTSHAEHVWTELSLAAELRHWFDLAISKIATSTPPDVTGRLWLGRCGWLAVGDPKALAASQRAIENFRSLDNDLDLGRALWRHAYHFISSGDIAAAAPFLLEAEALLRRIRPSKALVSCLRAMALARARAEDFEIACQFLQEALSVARRLRSQREIALALGSIAEIEFATGRVDAAIVTATQALAALGDAQKNSAWAQRLSGAIASYLLAKNEVAKALPLTLARLHAARAMGMQHEVVSNLERLGLIAAKQNEWTLAGHLSAYSTAYHSQRKVLRFFNSQFVYEQLQTELNKQLSPEEQAQLESDGRWQDEEQLMAEVAALWPRI